MAKRKGLSGVWFGLVRMAEQNKESVVTASILLYALGYLVVGIGGLSFQVQPAMGYVNSISNSNPSSGSTWVEDESLHWSDGSNEYFTVNPSHGNGADGFEHSGASDGASIPANSDWITDNYALDYETGTTSQGSYSAYTGYQSGTGGVELMHKNFFDSNRKPSTFSFSYRETSNSHGHATTLKDASGNRVLAIGTDNPQLDIYSASGWNDVSGTCSSSYTTWYDVTVNIDWAAGTFTVDRSDGCSVGPYDLRNTNGVRSVYFENQAGGFDGTANVDSWFDDVRLTGRGKLKASFHLDSGSGTTAIDSSKMNNDGKINGATWTTGKRDDALSFDGSDDYVSTPFRFADSDFTASYWVKTTDGRGAVLDEWTGSNAEGVVIGVRGAWGDGSTGALNAGLRYTNGNANNLVTDNSYNDGNWHHVAVTRDTSSRGSSSQFNIYVDGQDVATSSARSQGDGSLPNHDMWIGRSRYRSSTINGDVDEIRIYDRILSQDEIQKLYSGSDSRPGAPTGSTWVEGGSLRFIDENGFERAVASRDFNPLYEWYDTSTLYNNDGHPSDANQMNKYFDESRSDVSFGGSGDYNDRVYWHSSQWDAKPSYLPTDGYSWKMEGYIWAPSSGTYQFAVDSDDASDVFVNNQKVAGWYGGHGTSDGWTHNGQIDLDSGWHKIRVRMEEGGGGDGVGVAWQKPSDSSWNVIPASQFSSGSESVSSGSAWLEDNLFHFASESGSENVIAPYE